MNVSHEYHAQAIKSDFKCYAMMIFIKLKWISSDFKCSR